MSVSRALASAGWIYAAGAFCAIDFFHWPKPSLDVLTDRVAVPAQVLAMGLVARALWRAGTASGSQRSACWMLFAYIALSVAANSAWINLPDVRVRAELTPADGLFLLDYGCLLGAFALLFIGAGGSFRQPRFWLEALTMVLVQLAGLWALVISPRQPLQVSALVSPAMMGTYAVMLASLTSMAALLWMRVRAGRGQAMVLFLIVAALVAISSEVLWLVSWLADEELAGPFYNFGDVLCAACIGSAAVCMEWRAAPPSPEINYERSVESFMPALAALLAIALVAGLLATTRRSDAWILVSLVLLCMLLLLVRQRNVREELRRLQTTLALRDADARLTELVRRSVDLILVVDPACVVRYASPAAERMLARKPAELQGTRAVDLFGPGHVGNLSEWFGSLRAADGASDIEVRTLDPAGGGRILKINGSNEIDNRLINGMVLTVRDVTEQRALEREVLDVATRERTRLSAEIQDGLVEDLAGIALLLQAAAVSPDPDPIVNRSQLKGIVSRVNRTIGAARDLAHGLSPLYVVRGSLTGALRRLAQEHAPRKAVRLTVDPTLDEFAIDEFSADHLYRIAQEAVGTAVARADSTGVVLALGNAADSWVISISDDGRRGAADSQSFLNLGLKLIEYRARILGGTVRVESFGEGGTSVVVTVPRRASAPVALQARKNAARRRS